MAVTMQSTGIVSASTDLTVITAHTSAHTKGSYTQLVASTSFTSTWGLLQLRSYDLGLNAFLIDIATGGAGSESVRIANVPLIGQFNVVLTPGVLLPLAIASGTRVAARCQCAGAGGNRVKVGLLLLDSGMAPTANADPVTYGAVTGTTLPTAVDAGASVNTKGSWVELTASTSAAAGWLVINVQPPPSMTGSASFLIDIGTGAGGAETVIIPDVFIVPMISGDGIWPAAFHFPVAIAAGTRIAARAACSSNGATDRVVNISLLAVDASMPAGGSGGGLRLAGHGGLAA